ncbi:MAG: glycosyltransferase [Gottschalkiaceae bacterium]|nr:MAG: glycosyltransferase [Gottschalkiaceae bacterium]
MKIAMLLDNPFTEKLPYPKRVYYEAKSLVKNGHDVTVYCKNEKDIDIPKFEIRDGIKIKRCFDFFLGTTVLVDKYLTAHFDLFNSISETYDAYHCHDIFTWPIGYILSRRDNAKFICETHEYFPDYICEEWHTDKFKYELTKMLVDSRGNYIKYGDKVISVSEKTANALQDMFSLKEKPTVIYNSRPKSYINELKAMQAKSTNLLRKLYKIDESINILFFQGLVEPARGLDIAINIIKHLDNCVLVIAGQGKDEYIKELEKLVAKIGVKDKVIFTGFMPSDELFMYSSYADFLVYFGKKLVKNMDLTIPNKFFDYIMIGKPIIASNLQALDEIIKKYEIGLVVDIESEDISALAEEICSYMSNNKLINSAKKNIEGIQEYYSWESQEEKLLELYKDL